jgi:hypothetical protein
MSVIDILGGPSHLYLSSKVVDGKQYYHFSMLSSGEPECDSRILCKRWDDMLR